MLVDFSLRTSSDKSHIYKAALQCARSPHGSVDLTWRWKSCRRSGTWSPSCLRGSPRCELAASFCSSTTFHSGHMGTSSWGRLLLLSSPHASCFCGHSETSQLHICLDSTHTRKVCQRYAWSLRGSEGSQRWWSLPSRRSHTDRWHCHLSRFSCGTGGSTIFSISCGRSGTQLACMHPEERH